MNGCSNDWTGLQSPVGQVVTDPLPAAAGRGGKVIAAAVVAAVLASLSVSAQNRPAAAADPTAPRAAPTAAATSTADGLTAHGEELERWRHTVEAVLGPMPAIANTPFFGLTLLSGAALVAHSDWVQHSNSSLVRSFRTQPMVVEAGRYANLPLFCLLAVLTLVGYLANSGKIRGIAGKVLRLVEDGSSWLIYAALASGLISTIVQPTKVVAMGLGVDPLAFLTTCGLALGLGFMMLARYTLDVAVWLTPIPFIDFAFETLKKIVSVAYLALALFAPRVTAVLSALLLLGAFIAARWTLRLAAKTFRRLFDPTVDTPAPAPPSAR